MGRRKNEIYLINIKLLKEKNTLVNGYTRTPSEIASRHYCRIKYLQIFYCDHCERLAEGEFH